MFYMKTSIGKSSLNQENLIEMQAVILFLKPQRNFICEAILIPTNLIEISIGR